MKKIKEFLGSHQIFTATLIGGSVVIAASLASDYIGQTEGVVVGVTGFIFIFGYVAYRLFFKKD